MTTKNYRALLALFCLIIALTLSTLACDDGGEIVSMDCSNAAIGCLPDGGESETLNRANDTINKAIDAVSQPLPVP